MNDSPAHPVLRCEALTKTFREVREPVRVLRGVDLAVDHGACVAVVGTSGSGKSTLLHILGGLDQPTSGKVQVAGEDMSALSDTARGRLRNRALGFIYQFHHLLPEFTAIENVAMPLLVRRGGNGPAFAAAEELLRRVGLGARLEHKPTELSGGERQRAAVARALVTRPRCILADEPTGNLDHRTAATVFEIMLELNRELGTSLIMATHDRGLAARMDQVWALEDGQLARISHQDL